MENLKKNLDMKIHNNNQMHVPASLSNESNDIVTSTSSINNKKSKTSKSLNRNGDVGGIITTLLTSTSNNAPNANKLQKLENTNSTELSNLKMNKKRMTNVSESESENASNSGSSTASSSSSASSSSFSSDSDSDFEKNRKKGKSKLKTKKNAKVKSKSGLKLKKKDLKTKRKRSSSSSTSSSSSSSLESELLSSSENEKDSSEESDSAANNRNLHLASKKTKQQIKSKTLKSTTPNKKHKHEAKSLTKRKSREKNRPDSQTDSNETENDEQTKKSNSEEEGEIKEDDEVVTVESDRVIKTEIDPKQLAHLKKKYQECEKNLKKIHKILKSDANKITTQSSPTLIEKVKILKRKKHSLEKKYISYKSQLKEILGKSTNKETNENKIQQNRSSRSSLEKSENPSSKSPSGVSASHSNKVKLPYPVLNDKRDKNIIIDILLEKKVNLEEMLEQTLRTFHNLGKDSNDRNQYDDEKEVKARRLKSLEENIRTQLTRLDKQIDFIKWNIDLDKVNKKIELDAKQFNPEQIHSLKKRSMELTRQIEAILKFMIDENENVLNNGNKNQLNSIKSDTSLSSENSSKVDPSSFYRTNPPPMPHLNSHLSKNESLAMKEKISNNHIQLTTHQAGPNLYKNNYNNEMNRSNDSLDFKEGSKNHYKSNYSGSQGNKFSSESFHSSKVSTPPPANYPIEEKVSSNKFINNQNVRTPPIQSSSQFGTGQNSFNANGKFSNELNKNQQQANFTESSYKNQQNIPAKPFPSNDPKAIAAMLNEKYGHKNNNSPASHSQLNDANKSNLQKDPQFSSKPPGNLGNKIQNPQSETIDNLKSVAPSSETNPGLNNKKSFQPIASVFAAATAAVIKQNSPQQPQASYQSKDNNLNIKEVSKYPHSNLVNEPPGVERVNFVQNQLSSKNQQIDFSFLNPASMQAFQSQLPANFAEMMNSPSFMASMTSMFNALTQNGTFSNNANFNFANMQGMMQKFCNDWNKNTNMNTQQQQFKNKNRNPNFNKNDDYDSKFPHNNSNLTPNFNNFNNTNANNSNNTFFKEFYSYMNGFSQNMNRPMMSNDDINPNEPKSGGFYSNSNFSNKNNNNSNINNKSLSYYGKNQNFNNNNGNNNFSNNNNSYNFQSNDPSPMMPPTSSQHFNYRNTNNNNMNMNNPNNVNKRRRF